ncbi:MAG: S8 family serine peptidase [Verrucomicrobia bacterium]|nr:S8 family serine peptidase [Verrucomicrobiota bacterium]
MKTTHALPHAGEILLAVSLVCAPALTWPAVAADDPGATRSASSAPATQPAAALAQTLPMLQQPPGTVLNALHEPSIITVKFRDGLNVRLRNNELVSSDAALFTQARPLLRELALGKWRRADALPEEKIDELRQRAQANLGRPLPDLNLQFYLALPPGLEAAAVIDRLNALDIVELAQPVPRPVRPPTPPNYEPAQTNFFPAPLGMDVWGAWTNYSAFGHGIQVVDCEYSYNPQHRDLPSIPNLDATAIDPYNDTGHGTAVLGAMGALHNGWGTAGISPAAKFYFSGTYFSNGLAIDQSITTALGTLVPGDVLVIEQQTAGPNTTNAETQFGLVPVEWYRPNYDRIVTAVGLGIVVVEAAGNGWQNLDDPIYSTNNYGHWPFLATNNSGAIIVGAGASAKGSTTERSRIYYSNYGSCVDLQGWGENVLTTGYGDLYKAEGTNLLYTTFSGTSSATPMVAGACALLQSTYKTTNGAVLSPARIKSLLRSSGLPQKNGDYPSSQNIGPIPIIPVAIAQVLRGAGDAPIAFTGFNRDVIVERAATGGTTAPYAQAWDGVTSYGLYEAGLGEIGNWSSGSGSEGMPQGGTFASMLDGRTTFQLGPYNGSNVLYLAQTAPAGTLTLTTPQALRSLSILAASANGGANGSLVIHFANNTTSPPIIFNASDWHDLSGPIALTQYGSIALGNFGAFYTEDPLGHPNLYQTTTNLAARGWHTNPIVSITFTQPNGAGTSSNTTSGIFALSGTPTIRLAVLQYQGVPGFTLNWAALAGYSYQVQYQTNLTEAAWLNLGSPVVATGSTAAVVCLDAAAPSRFYRVFQLP